MSHGLVIKSIPGNSPFRQPTTMDPIDIALWDNPLDVEIGDVLDVWDFAHQMIVYGTIVEFGTNIIIIDWPDLQGNRLKGILNFFADTLWRKPNVPIIEIVKKSSGAFCHKKRPGCVIFNNYAEPNNQDGTYTCYMCRGHYA